MSSASGLKKSWALASCSLAALCFPLNAVGRYESVSADNQRAAGTEDASCFCSF